MRCPPREFCKRVSRKWFSPSFAVSNPLILEDQSRKLITAFRPCIVHLAKTRHQTLQCLTVRKTRKPFPRHSSLPLCWPTPTNTRLPRVPRARALVVELSLAMLLEGVEHHFPPPQEGRRAISHLVAAYKAPQSTTRIVEKVCAWKYCPPGVSAQRKRVQYLQRTYCTFKSMTQHSKLQCQTLNTYTPSTWKPGYTLPPRVLGKQVHYGSSPLLRDLQPRQRA